MLSKLQAIFAGIGILIAALVAAFLKGRSSGKEDVQREVQADVTRKVEEVAEVRATDNKVVKDAQKEAINSSDSVIDSELADKWTRK